MTIDETRLLLELYYLTARINRRIDEIMTTQAEAAAALAAVKTQNEATLARLEKVTLEIGSLNDKVAELQAAAGAAGDIDPALQSAIDGVVASAAALAAQAQVADDQVPDAPTA